MDVKQMSDEALVDLFEENIRTDQWEWVDPNDAKKASDMIDIIRPEILRRMKHETDDES